MTNTGADRADGGSVPGQRRRSGRPPADAPPGQPRDRQILDAAVSVFAQKGFHAARISDIAAEAGVAYGLVYHYFCNKDEILEQIFQRTWSQLSSGIRRIGEQPTTASDRLTAIVDLMLHSYRSEPELVRVLVLEVTRSPQLRDRVREISSTFASIEQVVIEGQASGELRADVSPQLATHILWGGLDEVITGWIIGTLADSQGAFDDARHALVSVMLGGLLAEPER